MLSTKLKIAKQSRVMGQLNIEHIRHQLPAFTGNSPVIITRVRSHPGSVSGSRILCCKWNRRKAESATYRAGWCISISWREKRHWEKSGTRDLKPESCTTKSIHQQALGQQKGSTGLEECTAFVLVHNAYML